MIEVVERNARLVITLNDVTEIRNARRFAERIVETVPTPFLVLDSDLRVILRTAVRKSAMIAAG